MKFRTSKIATLIAGKLFFKSSCISEKVWVTAAPVPAIPRSTAAQDCKIKSLGLANPISSRIIFTSSLKLALASVHSLAIVAIAKSVASSTIPPEFIRVKIAAMSFNGISFVSICTGMFLSVLNALYNFSAFATI